MLLTAWELLDAPNHRILVGYVLDGADVGAEDRGVDVGRNRNNDLDVVCDGLRFELGLSFDYILDLGPCEVLDDAFDPYQWLDLGIQSVCHQLELPVRRDKCDVPLALKLVQPDTLVELNVFHLDKLALGGPSGHVEERLVIEP